MIWKTTKGLNQEVTWYSESKYVTLLYVLDDVKELLELHQHCYGSFTHIERALARIEAVLET